jgi:hypothetical protein
LVEPAQRIDDPVVARFREWLIEERDKTMDSEGAEAG